MTIYANILHIPYLHNLALAFPEHQFVSPDWTIVRELPENVSLVNLYQYRGDPVDIVIDSARTFDAFNRPCSLKVKLLHNEEDMTTTKVDAFIKDCVTKSDCVVSVSEHKMWTLRHHAYIDNVTFIPLGVADVKVGTPIPGLIGTVHNHMNDQQEKVWNHVLTHFPGCELTGFGNELPGVEPKTYSEFDERFSRIDVFVNPVVGNSVGLTFAEAMMRGIPVVTGINTDLPKELISGWNCLITRSHLYDCLDEMAHLIDKVSKDREMRTRIGNSARVTAERIYGLEKFRSRWEAVFNKRKTT